MSSLVQGWWDPTSGFYTDLGITPATNGQAVEQWNDRSGNSNNAIQTTAGARGIYTTGLLNGLAGLLLDGVDDNMLITSMTGIYSCFVVANCNRTDFSTGGHYDGLFTDGANKDGWVQGNGDASGGTTLYGNTSGTYGARTLRVGGTSRIQSTGVNPPGAQFAPMLTYKSVSCVMTNPRTGSFNIGWTGLGTRFWSGNVIEVIAFNVQLTSIQIDNLCLYARDRYAISINQT